MKPAPTPAARTLRRKLETLAERGATPDEKKAAADKLARLLTRYNWSIPDPDDIFSAEVHPAYDDMQKIASFSGSIPGVAEFAKWALENRYHVEGTFRSQPGEPLTLHAGVMPSSVRAVRIIVETIRDSFGQLWQEFRKLPGATDRDAVTFLSGLYDGLMDESREAGQMIPQRSKPAVKARKGKRAAIIEAPGLSIHPYTVAVDLGARIRYSIPASVLSDELRAREEMARLAA